jgi:hypothetical protein
MEIKETFSVSNLYELREHLWSGALQRIDEAIENGIEEEFFEYIKECFEWEEEIDLTQVNDFVWFECDEWLQEHTETEED